MSIDLQRKVVRAIIQSGDLATFLQSGISVDWFDDLQAKQAFDIIVNYSQAPETSGKVPGVEYLQARAAMIAPLPGGTDLLKPEDHNAQLAQAMRVTRLRRLVSDAWKRVETSVLVSNPEEAHQQLLEALTGREISALRSSGRKTNLSDLASAAYDRYTTQVTTEGVTGVLTPFEALTYAVKGWNRGELYCLFAPPKSLKSWIMLACALRAFQTDSRHVLFITSEMPAEQLAGRLVCMMHGWDFNHWRDRTIPEPIIRQLLAVDLERRFHFYQPSGTGEQALAEVRSVIASLNMQGGVSLVLWDGHYRSAGSEEHEDIYHLVRRTRAMALEPEILQPSVLITAQEGSKPGAPTHKAYRQEASLMMYVTKISPDSLMFQTTDVREGPSLEMEIGVDFTRTALWQREARVEGRDEDVGTGSWV